MALRSYGVSPDSRGAPPSPRTGPKPPSAVSFRAAASMGGTSRLRRSPSCVHGFRRLRSRWPVDRAVPRKDPCFDRTHRRCPHEELLGRTCSPMRGEGYRGLGILGGAGGPGRYRENRLHRHRLRRLPPNDGFLERGAPLRSQVFPGRRMGHPQGPRGSRSQPLVESLFRRSPGLVSASPGSLCRGPEGRCQASPPPRCDSSSVHATRGGLGRPRGPGRQPVLRRPSVMQLNRPIGSLNRSKGYGPLEHGD